MLGCELLRPKWCSGIEELLHVDFNLQGQLEAWPRGAAVAVLVIWHVEVRRLQRGRELGRRWRAEGAAGRAAASRAGPLHQATSIRCVLRRRGSTKQKSMVSASIARGADRGGAPAMDGGWRQRRTADASGSSDGGGGPRLERPRWC